MQYQLVVVVGLVVLTAIATVACAWLSALGVEHPSGLCAVAGTGLGALAALAVQPRPPSGPSP